MANRASQRESTTPAAPWLWLVLVLAALPACFLPPWDERSWVDDDDTVGDDDDTTDDDDDDTTVEPISFTGEADVDVSSEGWFDTKCLGSINAELDADRIELSGDGACELMIPNVGTVMAGLDLDCVVSGEVVGGTMSMTFNTGYSPVELTTAVDGSYDAEAGTIEASISGEAFTIEADGTLDLTATD